MFIFLIIGATFLFLLIMSSLIWYLYKKGIFKKKVKQDLDLNDFITTNTNIILESIGKDNISLIECQSDRIKISVKDILIVDLEKLQTTNNSGIAISSNILISFGKNSNIIYKNIQNILNN